MYRTYVNVAPEPDRTMKKVPETSATTHNKSCELCLKNVTFD